MWDAAYMRTLFIGGDNNKEINKEQWVFKFDMHRNMQ
jgi:hypothetical protein